MNMYATVMLKNNYKQLLLAVAQRWTKFIYYLVIIVLHVDGLLKAKFAKIAAVLVLVLYGYMYVYVTVYPRI